MMTPQALVNFYKKANSVNTRNIHLLAIEIIYRLILLAKISLIRIVSCRLKISNDFITPRVNTAFGGGGVMTQ